jgi:tRNA threonylcarbamoyl adenosine modification protein YeaZ
VSSTRTTPHPNAIGITLAIESTNPGGASGATGVCVGRVDASGKIEVLAKRALAPESRHDDGLMPAIALACDEASLKPRDLDRIAVSLGPGGFTGVRIGVMTAQSIALATGAACVGVPTAEALVRHVPHAGSRRVGVLLAWKRDTVWRQAFEGEPLAPVGEGTIVQLSQAVAEGAGIVIADPALSERLVSDGADPSAFVAPTFDPVSVLEASIHRAPSEPHTVLPIYPREPEAVTNWRILKSS